VTVARWSAGCETPGAMLHTHRSESGTALVGALARLLLLPMADPFTPDVVAVPAQGIERWIAQRLSHHLGAAGRGDGVCANVVFPRPGDLLDDALASASPQHAEAVQRWHPERTVWPLLDLLDDVLDGDPGDKRLAVVRRHLRPDDDAAGDTASGRRYAVARRVAGLFGSYAANRPDLVRSWAQGDDADVPPDLLWQPVLWRRLRDAVGEQSPAELLDEACHALRERPQAAVLPERLSLYGVSRLDTARLQVLTALAEHRDVHLWLNHASPVLWEALRHSTSQGPRRADVAHLDGAVRNPLLASLSRDVRELQLQLRLAAVAPGHGDTHHEAAPRARTLLGRLQDDLLHDRWHDRWHDRSPDRSADHAARHVLDPTDRSVQVHACHGRARQVEVLREVVLGLLADDRTLEPRDVLVMCPDVETYAPLVAAVFGTDSHPGGRLRVRLADRSPRQVNPLLGVVGALVELAGSRLTASQVLDLIGAAPVRLRFRLSDDDMEQLRAWTVASGAHWGLSAEHRVGWQMQRLAQGTWRAALDRLLTGVAMGEHQQPSLLGGTLPLEGVDSADVDLAGRLAELLDRLDTAVQRLGGTGSADRWLEALEECTLSLAEVPPDGAWQLVQLRAELEQVREAAAGSAVELSLGDVRSLLEQQLAGRPTRSSFRTGGITVCTLVPMRSVPHRVVCLLGLDDGAFPRHSHADGDDLLARDPQLGERDPRSEDRQLLLDALMATGEHLVITYSGADVRTGATLPPAVPLGELLDALDAAAETADGRPVREGIVVRHPLQPFDVRNFMAEALGRAEPFSFDVSALSGARSARQQRIPPVSFLTQALPPAEDLDVLDRGVLDLGRLVDFWLHPAKAFLRQRLDLAAPARDEQPDDAMPITLDNLQKWQIGDRVLAARLRGMAVADIRAVEEARGELPPPPLGDDLITDVGKKAETLVVAADPWRGEPARTVDVDVVLGLSGVDVRLVGSVRDVRDRLALTITYSKIKAKQRMRAWIELLALSASVPTSGPAAEPAEQWRAVVVGQGRRPDKPTVVGLGPVPPQYARELLTELVTLRSLGLRSPLPVPLAAAAAYAELRHQGAAVARAVDAASKEWTSGYGYPSDDQDPDQRSVWGGVAPLDTLLQWRPPAGLPLDLKALHAQEPTVFGALACSVWWPLLDHEGLL